MTDYTARRLVMVDSQVRPSDVTKFPIIDAMLNTPREAFVPDQKKEAAYVGEHLDLGEGRVLLDPRVFAKMLDALNIQPEDVVLDIGCGLGYSTAVLARMAAMVVAVEDDAGRVSDAQSRLSENGADNAAVIEGALPDGAAKHGPYDAMILEGAIVAFPEALAGQLRDGGRVAAIFAEGANGVVRIGRKTGDRMDWRDAFNASAPVLPGFSAQPEFVL